jgi:peptidoglycan hydrolase CwlO-like protein
MKLDLLMSSMFSKSAAVLFVCLCSLGNSQAALFEDDEARKAILDLRQRVEVMRGEADQARRASATEVTGLGKSLLDLQRQIELLKAEIATLRGSNEQIARELSEIQRQQKDQSQAIQARFAKIEPVMIQLDGVEFLADQNQTRDFEAALAVF